MGETTIEWTDFTFNPWEGCQKVGQGCDNCYAEARDKRFTGGTLWGPHAARRRTSPTNWRKPLAWDKAAAAAGERHRVFCASLADVFDNHPSILPEWRADLWDLIRATPNLDWMLLTKRPGNIAKMLPEDWGNGYPNVWLGCTVVNQEEADRDVPKLLAVPAAVRFLSMEPLLGPVDLREVAWHRPDLRASVILDVVNGIGGYGGRNNRLDLVIVGGESGPGARPMHPDWVRSLRDQCQAAGVPFHFKQWGEWLPEGDWYEDHHVSLPVRGWNGESWTDDGRTGGEWVARIGKKAAGRKLDGRTWDQMPGEGEA